MLIYPGGFDLERGVVGVPYAEKDPEPAPASIG